MRKVPNDGRLGVYSLLCEEEVDSAVRARVVWKVMAAVREAGRPARPQVHSLRRLWVPVGVAAGVALVAGLALMGRHAELDGRGVEIVTIHANGGVRLEWADAGKPEYRVLKSANPADFSRAQEYRVRGTEYLDQGSDPKSGSTSVVYYRIE